MKTIYVIILVVVAAFFNQVKAQYPIPSYKVPVQGKAVFQENDEHKSSGEGIKRIRNINIRKTCSHHLLTQSVTSVWIYSLDGHERYGPFTLGCDETLTYEIDERAWGVYIETDDEILVDVWIE